MRGERRRGKRGFTLVELLVALAIAAALAAIAWPGYRQVMHRSQRIEARLALLRLQYLQERHFADHHVYAGGLGAEGSGGLAMPAVTEYGNYDLSVMLDVTGQAYVVIARARPSGRQAGDRQCQALSIDALGTRRSAAADGQWRPEPGGGCWS
ncbi:MAG TPA: type IV pilin protein [Steroidobacteraceae bacterium]|nr:type IV pilin protein [Steroidobacteraceae bacterium]